jgi:hypothetical protein
MAPKAGMMDRNPCGREVLLRHALWSVALWGLAILPARANSISVVMGLTGLVLLYGNALIGLIEGLMLGFIFKTGKLRAIAIMVLANYVSAFAAYIASNASYDVNLNNAVTLSYIVPVVCFICTILIEWPFCHWALRESRFLSTRTIKAVLMVNVTTYAMIVPIYYHFSDTSLYRLARWDQSVVTSCKLPVVIYYRDGDEYFRIAIDGTNREKLSDQDPFPPDIPEGWVADDWNTRFRLRDNVTLPSDLETPWDVWAIQWGLNVRNKETGQSFKLNFDTFPVSFRSRRPVQLPGNLVVYNVGAWLVLLDLNTMSIGQITKGSEPVVALKSEQSL